MNLRNLTYLYLLLLFTIAATFPSHSQLRSTIGVDVRPSYPFSSFHDDVMKASLQIDDTKKSRFATSIHLKYSFTFSPDSKEGRFFPGVWQGIGAAVNFFGNPQGVGTPLSFYLFQGAPVWKINNRLSLYYEWNFGISAGWKPCDGEIAYSNLIVGSRVNAYINAGTGLLWKLNDNYSLTAGIDLTHFSNGNTSYPNPGVNMAGVRIGLTHSFGKPISKEIYHAPDSSENKRKFGFDVMGYGAWRKRVYRGGEDPILLRGHFAVAGINLAPMWEIDRIFRTGPSLDIQWDQSTNLRHNYAHGSTSDDIYFYRPKFMSQLCFGLSGRAELVMPIFSVNVGIGYYLIGPEETRASYQLANLKIRMTRGLFLNIGYQLLNFQKQNNLMLGLGYSFR
ncbi:MAG: acyloxyacyl hydrolase [Muribaculaceae bacterium]|nr:acyloxyacyl hydrolase [Muribaculaceae bacterium]